VNPEPIAPVANDAWYLHSRGRRFGPLDDDGMRGYFRAGMVVAGDQIAVPGQHGNVSAAEAAALLGHAAPARATAPMPAPMAIVHVQTVRQKSYALLWVGALVGLIGLAYYKFHVPLQPKVDSPASADANDAALPLATTTDPLASAPAPGPSDSGFPVRPTRIVRKAPSFGDGPVVEEAAAPPPSVTAVPVAVGTPASAPTLEFWSGEASRLESAGAWAALKEHATKWTANQPARDTAWWFLGIANLRMESYAEAETALKRALQLSPNHFGVRSSLATVYLGTQRYRDAAGLLTRMVQEQPGNATAWNDLGIAMDKQGESDEAMAAFEKAVKLDPSFRLAWYNLAVCYRNFGYLDKARAARAKYDALR
jgi:hypothetical protein